MDMGGSREYEEILNFINEQITPHLRLALRAVGESRPEDPVAFIAGCFVSGTVPEVAADRQESDQSLSAYLGQHQVVAIVQQAVGACAAAQPAPENPLQFVGEYIQDRHVRGAGGQEYQAMDEDEDEQADAPAIVTGEPEPQPDVTPTERLWVGGIPSNLVGGDSALSSVLNINANRNITSLFSQFGKVKHSTVRVKAGDNKSWALITFEDIASAKACHDEGIAVLDAKYEEIQLRVSYADVEGQLKKNSSGVLAQLAKKHEEDLKEEEVAEQVGVWMGGIPRHCVTGEVGEPGATLDDAIMQQINAMGEVLSTTVRVKDGENKSWCLITYNAPEDAAKFVEAGCVAQAEDGSNVQLIVKSSDVKGHASKATAGALASIAQKHDEEVEAARKLMRQMWDTMRSGDLKNPGAGEGAEAAAASKPGVARKLARYKAFDVAEDGGS